MKIKSVIIKFVQIFKNIFIYCKEIIISINNKSTRIAFTNFKDVPYDFFLFVIDKLFSDKYYIVKFLKPHINFFSVFGKKNKIEKSKAACKIFFTGENNNFFRNGEYKGNCIDSVNLSFGFDYMDSENYFRFPLWLLYYFHPNNTKDDIRKILNSFNKKYKKDKFCSLVASHDKNNIRNKMYNFISKIDHVDCPGSLLHNDDSLHTIFSNDKEIYLQQYKFNICPENSNSPGYVTEKIFQSLYSGCIPIYYGWSKDPEPDILNPNIILWYDNLDSENSYLYNEILKLNSNAMLYKDFMNQQVFCDTAVDKIFFMLDQFQTKIYDTIKYSLGSN